MMNFNDTEVLNFCFFWLKNRLTFHDYFTKLILPCMYDMDFSGFEYMLHRQKLHVSIFDTCP